MGVINIFLKNQIRYRKREQILSLRWRPQVHLYSSCLNVQEKERKLLEKDQEKKRYNNNNKK
jgi:hypothetical protein